MKRDLHLKIGTVVMAALISTAALAQESGKVEATAGADIVSSYIWRGQELGGVSIQPSLGLAYKGLSLGFWGSVGIDRKDTRELDLTLSYTTARLTAMLTDYWFSPYDDAEKIGYFHYHARHTQHILEGGLAYDFGPVAIAWYTNLSGNDARKGNGDRAYSTFIDVSVPFQLAGLAWTAEVGITPWEGAYADGFNVPFVALKAQKDISLTDSFALPVFAQAAFNPYDESAYLVFGISF